MRVLKRILLTILVLTALAVPLRAQGQLSVQVLQLLSRINTWIATQTFQDLRVSASGVSCPAIPATTTGRIYTDAACNLYFNGGLIAGAGGGITPHNLLSSTHSDTVASSPVRGGLIVANSTPAWAQLALGSSGQILTSNGTDAVWSFSGASLTNLPAANLTGTIAAISGANLTNLNASNLVSGTVPLAQLSGITNAQISNSAAIAYAKLNLTGSVVNGDLATGTLLNSAVNASAAIAYSKLNLASSVLFSDWASNSCTNGQIPKSNGTTWACATDANSGGTVTSTALSMPAQFSVAGSPVTGSGTLTVTLANQTANTVWAGPSSGGANVPTFRALVNADFPTSGATAGTCGSVVVNAQGIATTCSTLLNAATQLNNQVPAANGGTGMSTATLNNLPVGNGTTWVSTVLPSCSNGALAYNTSTGLFSCNTGSANRQANIATTGQTSAVTTTNLIASAGAGLYRVNVYHLNTRAASTSGSSAVTISWNDGTAAQTNTLSNITNTLGNYVEQTIVIRSAASQAITYATSYSSAGGTILQYSLYITVEAL